jgi:hypothetical protein
MNATDLARVSEQIAAKAALEYLNAHSLKADTAILADCLNARIKAALPEAIRDAREAFRVPGMGKIADATFAASMALAGIAAAREATK